MVGFRWTDEGSLQDLDGLDRSREPDNTDRIGEYLKRGREERKKKKKKMAETA